MATSNLTAQRLREVLHYNPDTGVFVRIAYSRSRAKVGDVAGGFDHDGYRKISVLGKKYLEHRLAWLYVHGAWPADQIDHIDGDRGNNAIRNLRESSHGLNHQNLRKPHADSRSDLLGVSYDASKGKWRAQLHVNGRNRLIGRFDSAQEAHAAYLTAKRKAHPACTI